MKKLMLIMLLGGFILTSCQKDDLSSQTELEAAAAKAKKKNNKKNSESSLTELNFNDCEPVNEAELYAGQNTYVGKVTVELNNGEYTVKYMLESGYCLTETHLSIVNDPKDFPIKGNGGPAPGQFQYKDDNLGCQSTFTYKVPDTGTYIAAHAVVNCVSGDASINGDGLPATASFSTGSIAYPGSEGGYFDITVSGGTSLDGNWAGWCANVKKPLNPNEGPFDASVFSTYGGEDLPGINDANLDLVNWIINNQDNIIGQTSPTGGTYNFGDVQWAIWELLNGAGCETCTGLGDKDALARKGKEIEELASLSGEGFEPGCDEYYLVIFVPTNGTTQPVMIPYPISCEQGDCEETAWARNSANSNESCGNMPGNNWATYFVFGDNN